MIRFAMVLVGSSGDGKQAASPHFGRRWKIHRHWRVSPDGGNFEAMALDQASAPKPPTIFRWTRMN
jgi:hypothetical protein